jgi:hypothetical protein
LLIYFSPPFFFFSIVILIGHYHHYQEQHNKKTNKVCKVRRACKSLYVYEIPTKYFFLTFFWIFFCLDKKSMHAQYTVDNSSRVSNTWLFIKRCFVPTFCYEQYTNFDAVFERRVIDQCNFQHWSLKTSQLTTLCESKFEQVLKQRKQFKLNVTVNKSKCTNANVNVNTKKSKNVYVRPSFCTKSTKKSIFSQK